MDGRSAKESDPKVTRRSFLAYGAGMIAVPALAQKAYVKPDGQGVVCQENTVKCPNGHQTCKIINLPLAVGNDSYEYPDIQQLRSYHVLRCDTCRVLFTAE